ncbi:MAG TPA: hypothetical protein VGO29_00335 [Solirubrobacteraceae bacterium]|nr:hypothetical protein [Solirubrobacteraceae bacterium]
MRLHGDDAPALRPDLLEQRDEQPPSLGGLGLQLPERGEVAEQLLGALDARVGGSAEALQLLLDRLAAHDVLRLRQVAEHVEVLQALQLAEQRRALGARRVALGTIGFDGLEHQVDELLVGTEVADPLHEL